ncbi:hypothetical protein GGD61_001006 [Bradyrhizobium sp. SBR1B]|nr:hypothetical protein [Bradyrhizobium sp. SBR1B]
MKRPDKYYFVADDQAPMAIQLMRMTESEP